MTEKSKTLITTMIPAPSALPPPALVQAAYRYCQAVTENHYENFPVASYLIPRKCRPAVAAIYAFARMADDFADEAAYTGRRHELLDQWQQFLTTPGTPTHPVFLALADARERLDLPQSLFIDLITAFRMDVDINRHANFASVLNYCRHSANPVGRLVLHLFQEASAENLELSDCICTALQLTNFWQDIAIDLKKNRIYIPADDMRHFGLLEEDLFSGKITAAYKECLQYQARRTRELFMQGRPLCERARGRLGVELRLTWLTGMTILQRVEAVSFDVFHHRPKLAKSDFIRLLPFAFSRRLFLRRTS